MLPILKQPITPANIGPYSLALIDKEIAGARDTLYRLKQAKNILPTKPAAAAPFKNINMQPQTHSNFADISQQSILEMPPLLSTNSTSNFILSESIDPDVNTYIKPFNNTIGILDDPLNMQKYAFNMYIKLQNDKLNNLNEQLTVLEKQKQKITNKNLSYPIKSIKNTSSAVSMNVDEYTSSGASTINYNVPYTKLKQSGSAADSCTPVNNSASNYYLLYGNQGCLSYDDPNSKYSFQPCNSNDPMQQFFINPVNNSCDYNNFTSNKIKSNSSVKMGFNVITPSTNVKKCLTTYSDNSVTIEPCMLNSTNNQKFSTFNKNIL